MVIWKTTYDQCSPIIQAPQLEEHSLSMSILLMNKIRLEGKYLFIDNAI